MRLACGVADVFELDQARAVGRVADNIERRVRRNRLERDFLVGAHIDLQRVLLGANIFLRNRPPRQRDRRRLRRLIDGFETRRRACGGELAVDEADHSAERARHRTHLSQIDRDVAHSAGLRRCCDRELRVGG